MDTGHHERGPPILRISEMRERRERETHLIPGVHGLSPGEQATDLIKVINGSPVDGPSVTSERGRVHDEKGEGTHSSDTHHAAGTSGLNERLRARGEARAEGPQRLR
jgi:hypothetical protein